MILTVKNLSDSSKIWAGVEIQPNSIYELNELDIRNKAFVSGFTGSVFLADWISGHAEVKANGEVISELDKLISVLSGENTSVVVTKMPEPPPFANPSGFRSRYRGYHFGTVAAGTTASLDIKIPATRFLQGIQLLIANGAIGDNASLEVVDVDGIMGYGTNLTLDRFGDNWFVDPQNILQRELISNYTAQIIGGLYIRIIYESIGTQDVSVYANLMLHVRQ
jgi:hypothetical protein